MRSPAPIGVLLLIIMTSYDTNALSWDPHYALYPRQYIVQRISEPMGVLDGNLEKSVWRNVPWSEPFGDIQGTDGPTNLVPRTQFKAVYDDEYLYIGAQCFPADDLSTEAHFTTRNAPIYQKDSDFEVFVQVGYPHREEMKDDSFSDRMAQREWHHDYKELEVNALNTVWNLLLDKPYSDGGVEHSGRVATDPNDPLYYEVYHQSTATRIVSGRINDPNAGALWTVEIALAYSDLLARSRTTSMQSHSTTTTNTQPTPFCPQTPWRINFSRVEKQGDINWTWQPQYRWDPERQRFGGFVNMHLPDAWGYLVFSADDSTTYRDPTWPAQLAAMCIYYAQQYHKEKNGSFAMDWRDLVLPKNIVDPFQLTVQTDGAEHFLATVTGHGSRVVIRDDRLLLAESIADEAPLQK